MWHIDVICNLQSANANAKIDTKLHWSQQVSHFDKFHD